MEELAIGIHFLGGKIMIEEIRCSYEVCKLLHEKGFDVKCTDWYWENNINIWKPTHQMAMKWLREVHNTCTTRTRCKV